MAVRELTPLRVLPAPPIAAPDARAVVEIYRPFFLAGILSVLTAGCTLGAVALLGIALQGSYTANAWTPYVLAHANSQLYGWCGLFIMGFALQQHPPRQSRVALYHRLAAWSLGLLAVGIGLRFAAEPLVAVDRGVWLPVGVLSCLLQVAAVALFVVNTAVTRYRTGKGLTWQTKFVFASLGWWALVVLVEPIYFALSHQADRAASIAFVAEWASPYREAQFLGFVTMMIFGVALVKMNSCFGARTPSRPLGEAGFALWNVGLVLRMLGWGLAFRADLAPGSTVLFSVGGAILAMAASLLVVATRMYEPLAERFASHKFIRAAFGWLLVAGVMLLLEPVHLAAIGQPFSHAYTGAVRHAVTVGFISQMILGVGMHVVARMNDIPETAVRPLWITFVLLNLGNTARVTLEVLTDYTGRAFLPMGFTGFVELIALALWGATQAGIMIRSRRAAHA